MTPNEILDLALDEAKALPSGLDRIDRLTAIAEAQSRINEADARTKATQLLATRGVAS